MKFTLSQMDNLDNILIRRAHTHSDRESVFKLRWLGYKKYFGNEQLVSDAFDAAANSVLLLATNAANQPLGTLRILDRRFGTIELDRFLPVDALLSTDDHPVAEATRLSVPPNPQARSIKLALWKAFYLYCVASDISAMLISARRSAARDYARLLFSSVGTDGIYTHASLGGIEHQTYTLHIPSASERYRTEAHDLYDLFIVQQHPQIQFL